ncbi:MAG: tRNA (adenosine(37)-N6)-dimethylallyltransferase MiaA [Verrucomicrobia bacterium]|nr:tRNA (adenosine(37)-N6)-dimethylallyltransferase MiaA [Verrucomicrobiota bacterium]
MSLAAHFLVGPTGVGKSAVAQLLAEQQGAPILSADSMLIYRGMDIGTAKPTVDERGAVPYFGVDLVDPDVTFSAWEYRRHALDALKRVPAPPYAIVTGGTGLYVKALTHGLVDRPGADPALRERWQRRLAEEGIGALQRALREVAPDVFESLADKQNPRRLIRALETVDAPQPRVDRPEEAVPATVVGLSIDPELLNERIAQRVHTMYDQGLLDEVEQLLAAGKPLSKTARQAIGYAEAMDLVEGRLTQAQAIERTIVRTRRLAKRQRTWFRHQADVIWVEVTRERSLADLADKVGQQWREHGPTAIRGESRR